VKSLVATKAGLSQVTNVLNWSVKKAMNPVVINVFQNVTQKMNSGTQKNKFASKQNVQMVSN